MKNTEIPEEFLPEGGEVIGCDGLNYDHLMVFLPGGEAIIMADFRREYLNDENQFEADEYAVIPANEDGELLFDKEAQGRILKQIWGYNPLNWTEPPGGFDNRFSCG